jgi:hypothetical protein
MFTAGRTKLLSTRHWGPIRQLLRCRSGRRANAVRICLVTSRVASSGGSWRPDLAGSIARAPRVVTGGGSAVYGAGRTSTCGPPLLACPQATDARPIVAAVTVANVKAFACILFSYSPLTGNATTRQPFPEPNLVTREKIGEVNIVVSCQRFTRSNAVCKCAMPVSASARQILAPDAPGRDLVSGAGVLAHGYPDADRQLHRYAKP